jgi:hypothetical protein
METDRRKFLFSAMAAGSAWSVAGAGCRGESGSPPSPAPVKTSPRAAPLDSIRVGLVGAGDRGTYLLRILLGIDGVQVRAICDPAESKVLRAQRMAEERRLPKPEGYSRGETDYRRMCQRDDLDLVINATPWPLHTPVCLAALEAGKHVATEAPAALTVEECWQQVETAQKAKRHCVILENYCYQRDVMMIWNMVRQGLFGEILHVEGGYQKDARDSEIRMNADGSLGWLGQFRKDRRGNVYPTHDIGPLAQWLDIHRGDRFDYLVSMGGNARAFNEYGARYFAAAHYLATTRFDMSDVNLCLIRTVKGRTVYLVSDTLLARPRPRNVYRLLGSKGIYDRTIEMLYVEGKSPKRDRWGGDWEPTAEYNQEFDHPLWRDLRSNAIGSGQGGADYLCVTRLVDALRAGTSPDMDVYDAAAWSSIVDLSEQSARNKSRPVDFPDFTRGGWQTASPRPIGGA